MNPQSNFLILLLANNATVRRLEHAANDAGTNILVGMIHIYVYTVQTGDRKHSTLELEGAMKARNRTIYPSYQAISYL